MKLTKGKISKLYSKNKQSLRRKKNGKGKTGRNRTFRKTKGLNLANKSLKSFYNRRGGAEEAEQSSVTPAEPVTSAEEGVKPVVTSTEEGAALAPAVGGPESVESTAIAPAVGGPAAEGAAVEPIAEGAAVEPIAEGAAVEPIAEGAAVEPVATTAEGVEPATEEPATEEPAAEEPVAEPAPAVAEPVATDDGAFFKSTSSLIPTPKFFKYFENLVKNIQPQTDDFGNTVNEAANAVTTGGKSHKFRLTRKKQTKNSNKKTKSNK